MAQRDPGSEQLGGEDYRLGAQERWAEASFLVRHGHYGGGIYLAGRSVEGILRAVIWFQDAEIRRGIKSLDTGHDLKRLLRLVSDLGLLRPNKRDIEFRAAVQMVAMHWTNNMRFSPGRHIEARWRRAGHVHRRRTLKRAASEYFDACSAIIQRCEVLCQD